MNRPTQLGLFSLYAAVLAAAAWVGTGNPLWIAAAALPTLAGLLLVVPTSRLAAFGGVALLSGLVAGFGAEWHLERMSREWPERARLWENEVQESLQDELDGLLTAGETAASELARRWSEGSIDNLPGLPDDLRRLPIHSLMVFGPSGELLAWDGVHQGPVPESVRLGRSRYVYEEGALFGYLYVTEPVVGGGVAAAAALLRSDLPPGLDPPQDDFESRFRKKTGGSIEVGRADPAAEGSIWDLQWDEESLFAVVLIPAAEADARGGVESNWERAVVLLLILGWFLTVLAARSNALSLALGAVTLPLLFLLLPFSRLTGGAEFFFSPLGLLLPGPLGLTLGDLISVGAAGLVALGLLPWNRLPQMPLIPLAVLAVLAAWGLLGLLETGSSRDLLAEGELGWVVFQGAAAALVLIPFGVVALWSRAGSDRRLRAAVPSLFLILAGGLAIGWVALLGRVLEPPAWIPLLWAVPLLGFVWGAPRGSGWGPSLIRWSGTAFLGASLVLPWAWGLRVEAQIEAAEERIDRLGTRSDPFLEFLLERAGAHAADRGGSGRDPVEVLYGAWTESGLAMEGLPLWITYWSVGGEAQEELRIGVSETRPPIPDGVVADALSEGRTVVRRFDLADAHYVSVVPLPEGGFVSAVVPPRRILTGSSPLGPLFSPARGRPDPLVPIPLLPGEIPGETGVVDWVPTADGWQGETAIAYPDEVYHAHYLIEFPGWTVLIARGGLVLLLNVALLGILWAAGRWTSEGSLAQLRPALAVPGSFRGRVTLALFAFFLLPSVAFGTLAYRTLSGATVLTAESLAERAVEDAGTGYFEVEGAMDLLASRVGSDLLLYEGGQLVEGSLSELVDLGLYEGWVPPMIHQVLLSGEALTATTSSSLGGWEYVVAYRRMPEGRILAAPAPLQAGATALRQREMADLIAFSLVLGGTLSVLLALAVGRALSRPIQTLRVASERVGAGNMSVHVPGLRTDEFGAVFEAFNRMVDRLAKAQTALIRSSQQSRAIVEEAAIGVVALDPDGRVTLANARAEELLGASLEGGEELPQGSGPTDTRAALFEWISRYLQQVSGESAAELSSGDRRIRIRARRVSGRRPAGGTVLTLEDVTDELRTERILAWGEMAQQVAHEVKNPLTPIKLGVQHIRRAWTDRQPDYEEILNRNVDAILGEIERLASIASSFSRFAAPSPAGAEPLEPVCLPKVVREVLDLYSAAGDPITFSLTELGSAPECRGRTAEIKEVLINLFENARTALPTGGNVRVEVEALDDAVELRVIDNGTGIAPEFLPRIFEPHFSTRSSGTGLGLAIVRRLVESWGGSVQAESIPDEGTTIHIRLRPWEEETAASGFPFGAGVRGDAASREA